MLRAPLVRAPFLGEMSSCSEVALVCRLECHTDTVSAVAATDAAVATGAWDCSVRLWQWHRLAAAAAEAGSGEGGPAEKRARTAEAPAATESAVTECAAVLGDHSQVLLALLTCM